MVGLHWKQCSFCFLAILWIQTGVY